MTDKEAHELIGEAAEKLANLPEMQKQMMKIAREKGKEAAEQMLYLTAIGALMGVNNPTNVR